MRDLIFHHIRNLAKLPTRITFQ